MIRLEANGAERHVTSMLASQQCWASANKITQASDRKRHYLFLWAASAVNIQCPIETIRLARRVIALPSGLRQLILQTRYIVTFISF